MFLRTEDKATGETALLAPAKVSPDFTVADVLAWALTKPADERYCYLDNENCALCHFLRETGRAAKPNVSGRDWGNGRFSQKRHPLDYDINIAAQAGTFGAFAASLREIA